MTSLRHNSADHGAAPSAAPSAPQAADAGAGERSPREDYLDAARACILDVGWRRTTLTEVARRAGVSRMTIYRAWSDMPQLLGDLMTREWGSVVGRTGAAAPDTSTPEGLAASALATVAALRENELFVRIVELDAELLLPYLLSRRGRSQEALVALVEAAIVAGQETGAMRRGEPAAMARAVVLAAHGFVLSALTMVDDRVALETLDAELRTLVAAMVAP